jgi:hypothetical protein
MWQGENGKLDSGDFQLQRCSFNKWSTKIRSVERCGTERYTKKRMWKDDELCCGRMQDEKMWDEKIR